MKIPVLILAMVFSFSSFATAPAEELPVYELDSENVFIDGDEAILARTPNTPKVVQVTMNVPMYNSECTRYDTRYQYGRNGHHCGYEHYYRYRTIRRCA
ncbi:MAG: hypothetical protein ACOCUH_02520, partial [Bacteriovoracia bacterium]